jgi:hypothetical protein
MIKTSGLTYKTFSAESFIYPPMGLLPCNSEAMFYAPNLEIKSPVQLFLFSVKIG